MSFFLLLNIEYILYRDAPKWKFLAEAKQNETLVPTMVQILNTVFRSFFYNYINEIGKICFLLTKAAQSGKLQTRI